MESSGFLRMFVMRKALASAVFVALCLSPSSLRADDVLRWAPNLDQINADLAGRVVDFTHNHGKDRRIWSDALCSKRDLYVYLPPGYDPAKKYPLALYLHGAAQDEQFFVKSLARDFDAAIVQGKIPPIVIAAPDGAHFGRPSFFRVATFWANTDLGNYEDYLMIDVWNFVMRNFSIRPERDAHALIGASMGGAGAFTQAIKHKDRVKIAMGFVPALNVRWVDCHGRYETPFDPACWGWREKINPFEVVGRPAALLNVRFYKLYGPLVGCGPDAMTKLSLFNPIEVMERYDLKPGELDLYIAYTGKDQFNMMAQVESFLFAAKQRGIRVGVEFDPNGRHDEESARRLFPEALRWVAPLMEKYRDPK
jgi:S-formylglutathione hydrolase FrmB